jgi:hypothetical protein
LSVGCVSTRITPEDFNANLSDMPHFRPRNQRNESHSIFRRSPSGYGRGPYTDRKKTFRLSRVPMSLYHLRRVHWDLGCWTPRVITPTLDETDVLHLDPPLQVRPRTLSPYAPMPPQPIFHLELTSGSWPQKVRTATSCVGSRIPSAKSCPPGRDPSRRMGGRGGPTDSAAVQSRSCRS